MSQSTRFVFGGATANAQRQRGMEGSAREGSNQQELLEEVEPHGRRGGRFVGALRAMKREKLRLARVGHDRRKIKWQLGHLGIDLRLLHRQVVARALAMIFARTMRMAVVLVAIVISVAIVGLFELRLFAATIIVRVVPAASDRCVNQQRCSNQAGK